MFEEEFEIAKEIIQLRKDANLTQKELAKLADTSQPAIARLESGNYKNVSLKFLRKVGKALNATPEIHFKKLTLGYLFMGRVKTIILQQIAGAALQFSSNLI